jgi:flagellar hook-associated protein 1
MSLFASLNVSAEALDNYQTALANVQNNVTNASTPGFARQNQTFLPRIFDPENGLSGGATLGPRENLRSDFAEQGVRRQNSLFGRFSQLDTQLSQIEPSFDVSGNTGVPAALGQLFDSFSALALNPNDTTSRQNVLYAAAQTARSFNSTSNALRDSAGLAGREVTSAVDHINELAAQVREYNVRVHQSAGSAQDPSLDAQVHAALESLSEFADVNIVRQPDQSFTVLLGGQTPLTIGDNQYKVTADLSSGLPVVRDSQGKDVSAQVTGGRLAGALYAANTLIPSLQSDLHLLAKSVADQVNGALAAGVDKNQQPGAPLFSYNQASDAASTLTVTALTPAQLAAATATAPGGNGNALSISALGSSQPVNGYTFSGFFGQITARIGRELNVAKDGVDTQQSLVAQARSLRSQLQGVSLDEEAVHLVELQRAYQAAAKMVTVLDDLTQTTIDMLR